MATEYGQIGMGGSVIPSSTQIRFAKGRLGQNVMNMYFTNPNKMTPMLMRVKEMREEK